MYLRSVGLPIVIFISLLVIVQGVGADSTTTVSIGSAPGMADMADAIRWYNEGVDRAQAGDFPGALTATEVALRIQPNFSLAWTSKSGILLSLDRPSEALGAAEEAVRQMNTSAEAWNNMASAYIRLGRFGEAYDAGTRAASLDPGLAEAWVNLGTAAGALGNYQEEIEASEKALALNPELQEAKQNLEYARSHLAERSPSGTHASPDTARQTPALSGLTLGSVAAAMIFLKRTGRC